MVKKLFNMSFVFLLCFFSVFSAEAELNNTYYENFDGFQDGSTISAVDSWQVDQGSTAHAITQSGVTLTGTGNSLELMGDELVSMVSRPKILGYLSPCWIEFYVLPGIGGKIADIPSGKSAAITFDYTGKVYAANGSSWLDTGFTFTIGQWYKVLLKLNFSSHLYSVYLSVAGNTLAEFIPVKENLRFIDTSVSGLSDFGFDGVYNASREDDNTYVDNILVDFIKRIEIISAAQTLAKGEVSAPITIQLQNDVSAPQTAWKDITLQFLTESESGEFSLDKDDWLSITEAIVPAGLFQLVVYYKDDKEGQPIISAKEDPDRGWDDALQQLNITSGAASFNIALTTPQVAGEYFKMTITVKDEEGDVDTSYNGEVEIIAQYVNPASGTMSISPEEISGFTEGELEVEAVYPDAGTIKIQVADTEDADKTGISGEVLFIPNSLTVSCSGTQIVNAPFDLEVTAYNAAGAITPNYGGSCELIVLPILPTDNAAGFIFPSSAGESDFVEGTARLNMTYDRWGTITIEARDTNNPLKKGISEQVAFYPKDVIVEITPASADRDFFYTGENIEVIVSVVDYNDVPIANYASSVNLRSQSGLEIDNTYLFTVSDVGARTFMAVCDSPGTYTISVDEASAGLTVQSESFIVKQATVTVISTEAPVGTIAEVFITLTDEDGNIISTENDLTIDIDLEEEFANNTSSSETETQTVRFQKGIAKFTVTDQEAETITITPKSGYKFKIKKGTVKFGRIAKAGIGTLMWREIR